MWWYDYDMDWNAQNIKVYDESADDLARHFRGIGSRTADIKRALKLANKTDGAKVVEIGCGDGRDAVEIVKRSVLYEGFDPSKGMLDIAKTRVKNASFVIDDALSYKYPSDVDVIFAFASLLHVDKTDLIDVFRKVHKSLRDNGIFYISLKERDSYQEEIKKDQHGERMFYYYNLLIIKHIAGSGFIPVYEDHQAIGKTNWFTIALRKI